ncbi:sigma-70 family RNA polymerase sigma factor [archaeon]|jgi:RNA polymerase sigma-70 factor, ECF subfamily|nr:sigma-70 family RNA polymerase sigma factor [archaeon]MBT3450627.1 sigma-70 family RNA polymerase sigma factor [archaeon]MBT6868687.1 sigma-70 family RNA polymerase sigma factor [archaeon]MBT7193475.1 sigma-70 family RNA polymerase sigma factor [archaeon]MBT7381066.1 sigma-70 family RNA polymerase sigma factor [archaeon]
MVKQTNISYLVDITKTDNELVDYAKKGDLEAVALLYLKHRNDIRKIGFKILKKEEDVEDLELEMVIKLVDDIQKYQRGNFNAWYKRVTRNTAYNMLRYNQIRDHESIENVQVYEFLGYADLSTNNPEKETHQIELTDKIEEAMSNINKSYRDVLKLRFWEGLTYKEISEELSLSIPNVTARINRGKKALKEYFSKEPEFVLELGYKLS